MTWDLILQQKGGRRFSSTNTIWMIEFQKTNKLLVFWSFAFNNNKKKNNPKINPDSCCFTKDKKCRDAQLVRNRGHQVVLLRGNGLVTGQSIILPVITPNPAGLWRHLWEQHRKHSPLSHHLTDGRTCTLLLHNEHMSHQCGKTRWPRVPYLAGPAYR